MMENTLTQAVQFSCSTIGCGREITLQQGGQVQTINSPGYPQTYQENNRCNWKIKVSLFNQY